MLDLEEATITPDQIPTTYGQDAMRNLQNLIGSAESATHGYNMVIGSKAHVPVTNMSIDEVLFHQDTMRSGGSPSTAVGRYQFLQKTLKGLKAELGLSGDEKMTPELQDRLAVHLMRRRGLDQFLKGEMARDVFVNNLAKEWAGLPTTGGQSYYHGDGLNRANVQLSEVVTAVTELAASAYAQAD